MGVFSCRFTQKQKLGPVRTAAVFNIGWDVFQLCVHGHSFTDCECTFKMAMIESVSAVPGPDDTKFWPEQVKALTGFMLTTFFKHFKLYSYVFTHEQDHVEHHTGLVIETPEIQSFAEAMSQSEWDAYQADIAAKAEAARQAAEAEEAARVAAERAAIEEAERAEAEAARQELLRRKPATLDDAIEHLVAVRLTEEKELLAAMYREKEEVLLARIALLGEKKGTKTGLNTAASTRPNSSKNR